MSVRATLQRIALDWDASAAADVGFRDERVVEAVVRLSRAFSYHVMDGDGAQLRELFADGGVYLNGAQGQTEFGVEAFLRVCRLVRERDLRIALTGQSFVACPVGEDACCVVGDFRLFMSVGTTALSFVRSTRMVYHWRIVEGLPRILCLEASFPIELAAVFEPAPAPQVAPEEGGERVGDPLVELRDTKRLAHYVSAKDIAYVEARGRKVLVHCEDEVVEVNEGISALERRLGDNFVRVHRSYLVNAWQVRSVSPSGVTLADGEPVPVSVRRLSKVRSALQGIRMPQNLSLSELNGLVSGITSGRDAS